MFFFTPLQAQARVREMKSITQPCLPDCRRKDARDGRYNGVSSARMRNFDHENRSGKNKIT
jgi:hypothetical protein